MPLQVLPAGTSIASELFTYCSGWLETLAKRQRTRWKNRSRFDYRPAEGIRPYAAHNSPLAPVRKGRGMSRDRWRCDWVEVAYLLADMDYSFDERTAAGAETAAWAPYFRMPRGSAVKHRAGFMGKRGWPYGQVPGMALGCPNRTSPDLPPMSKPNDNPADPFKKALAEATKVMADDPELNVSYTVDPSGLSGESMRLPQVSRRMTREEVLLARGTADALALQRRVSRRRDPCALRASGRHGAGPLRGDGGRPVRGDGRAGHARHGQQYRRQDRARGAAARL